MNTKDKKKILFVITNDIYIRNYLTTTALDALKKKFSVSFLISNETKSVKEIEQLEHFSYPVSIYRQKVYYKVFDLFMWHYRSKSKTFGMYFSILLDDQNCKSIYIPQGFAHGFGTLEKENIVIYSCTKYRDKNSETGITWDDKDLNINWGIKNPTISQKDKMNERFRSSESVERAILDEKICQYLYSEGNKFMFMDNATYEQIEIGDDIISTEQSKFFIENDNINLQFYEG